MSILWCAALTLLFAADGSRVAFSGWSEKRKGPLTVVYDRATKTWTELKPAGTCQALAILETRTGRFRLVPESTGLAGSYAEALAVGGEELLLGTKGNNGGLTRISLPRLLSWAFPETATGGSGK
jgi:hypothetical protein